MSETISETAGKVAMVTASVRQYRARFARSRSSGSNRSRPQAARAYEPAPAIIGTCSSVRFSLSQRL
jgi:hypothetical protein